MSHLQYLQSPGGARRETVDSTLTYYGQTISGDELKPTASEIFDAPNQLKLISSSYCTVVDIFVLCSIPSEMCKNNLVNWERQHRVLDYSVIILAT